MVQQKQRYETIAAEQNIGTHRSLPHILAKTRVHTHLVGHGFVLAPDVDADLLLRLLLRVAVLCLLLALVVSLLGRSRLRGE